MIAERGDVMWLAGLLEGEGWFGRNHYVTPTIKVSMTDRDVIARVAALFGNAVTVERRPVDPRRPNAKQQWSTTIYGHRAVAWMRVLLPHMGSRRSARISELLADWDAVEHKMPKGSGSAAATCHPDKPVMGGGLCGTCYARKYRAGWRVRSTIGSA
jgi:hypothetical protein